jgi:uncharacterized protein
LAEREGTLEGQAPLADFSRLMEEPQPPGESDGASRVNWTAHGERRPVPGGEPLPVLHLRARTTVQRTCQRCLQPVRLDVEVDRRFVFAPNESEAERWDADMEEDVLALSRSLNLLELVEDELLLALPLVPRHDDCALPAPQELERHQPFAALANWRRND